MCLKWVRHAIRHRGERPSRYWRAQEPLPLAFRIYNQPLLRYVHIRLKQSSTLQTWEYQSQWQSQLIDQKKSTCFRINRYTTLKAVDFVTVVDQLRLIVINFIYGDTSEREIGKEMFFKKYSPRTISKTI